MVQPDAGLWVTAINGFILLFLLLASGLISASEMAFFSLDPTDQEELAEKHPDAFQGFQKLLQNPRKLLATILVVNNMVNIAIVFVSTFILRAIPGWEELRDLSEFLIQAVAVTFLILLFGEILPKVYAKQYPMQMVVRMHRILAFLTHGMGWLTFPLNWMGHWLDKRLKKYQASFSADELSAAIALTADPTVSEEERKIWKGIVEFGRITVKETMRPRMDVVALDMDLPFPSVLQKITEAGYSRMPVFRETFDQIEGILYIKDVLPYLHENEDFAWQKLIRQAIFVPENKPIDDLLREFQSQKMHMAIVVDEYGGSSGIVTLEDVIEEIVGEINDEFDDEELIYSKLDAHTFVFEGKTTLIDVCRVIDMPYDDLSDFAGEADTLAGLVLNQTGSIPEKGQRMTIGNLDLTIESVDKKRIKRVKLAVRPETSPTQNLAVGLILGVLGFGLLSACGGDETVWVPRPRGYPVIPMPEVAYTAYENPGCPFRFEYATSARLVPYQGKEPEASCWFNMVYPRFGATLYFTYRPVKKDLPALIDDAHHGVNQHVMMAEKIQSTDVVRTEEKVFGTMFRLTGKPATPLQFYLTDSVSHFFRGVVYFQEAVSFDSLAPVVDFMEKDMQHLTQTFSWSPSIDSQKK